MLLFVRNSYPIEFTSASNIKKVATLTAVHSASKLPGYVSNAGFQLVKSRVSSGMLKIMTSASLISKSPGQVAQPEDPHHFPSGSSNLPYRIARDRHAFLLADRGSSQRQSPNAPVGLLPCHHRPEP